jgi:hypothetical protein
VARIFLLSLILVSSLSQVGCGNGAAATFDINQTSESFGQKILYNNKVDIVMIIDNSTSMKAQQDRLSQQMPSLVTALQNLKMDYHVVVITTSMGLSGDGGRFVGSPKILTSQTPNLADALTQRVVQGETGSDMERGLDSLEAALSMSYLSSEGAGFLRDDALLAVIELSDENDKSQGDANHYASMLDKLKPQAEDGRKSWIFNFIGVLADSPQCRTFNNYSEPGAVQMQLADMSGGNKESICSTNLSSAVTNIKARIIQILTDYYLSEKPQVVTIQVAVNGQLVPQDSANGWSYIEDGSKYIVRFNGTAVPPADADIRIDYKPAQAR